MTQEKKNIGLMISLAGLISLTSLFFFFARSNNDIDHNLFRPQVPESIDRVVLTSAKDTVNLSFENYQWKVDGKFVADQKMVTVLFATLIQAVPKRMASKNQVDSVKQSIIKNGIRVSMFGKGTLEKEFLVGGNPTRNQTYFMVDQEDIPYLVVIPGYSVYVAAILEQEAIAWREKRIFSFDWRNFKELRADFPSEAHENFTVAMGENYFTILGVNSVDTTALNNYLDAVSMLYATRHSATDRNPYYDSLTATDPLVSIKVEDIAGRQYKLELFPSKSWEAEVAGKISGDAIAYFDRRTALEVMKKRSSFTKKH